MVSLPGAGGSFPVSLALAPLGKPGLETLVFPALFPPPCDLTELALWSGVSMFF